VAELLLKFYSGSSQSSELDDPLFFLRI